MKRFWSIVLCFLLIFSIGTGLISNNNNFNNNLAENQLEEFQIAADGMLPSSGPYIPPDENG